MAFRRRPQPHDPPEPETPKAKVQKFVLRNAVVMAQEGIVAHSWRDPQTDKVINGGTMFMVLLTMAKAIWTNPGVCTLGNTAIADRTGVSERWIQLVKRAAVVEGLLIKSNVRSKLGTEIFQMPLAAIEHFIGKKAEPARETTGNVRNCGHYLSSCSSPDSPCDVCAHPEWATEEARAEFKHNSIKDVSPSEFIARVAIAVAFGDDQDNDAGGLDSGSDDEGTMFKVEDVDDSDGL